jgi:hypothetical protein
MKSKQKIAYMGYNVHSMPLPQCNACPYALDDYTDIAITYLTSSLYKI